VVHVSTESVALRLGTETEFLQRNPVAAISSGPFGNDPAEPFCEAVAEGKTEAFIKGGHGATWIPNQGIKVEMSNSVRGSLASSCEKYLRT